jgi:hypothetical protein
LYSLNQDTDQFLELNPTTGAIANTTAIGQSVVGEGAMAFNSTGTLFFSASSGAVGTLYSSTLNGSSSVVGALSVSMDGLDFAPNGTLYGISQDMSLYTIDPVTAGVTLVGPTGIGSIGPVLGFAIRQSDAAMYAAVGRSLYSIDSTTGQGTFIGVTGFDQITGLTFLEPGGGSGIPEPSTWAMMAGGLALVAMLRRR